VNFSAISKELLSKLSPSLQKAVSLAQENQLAYSSSCARTWLLAQNCLS